MKLGFGPQDYSKQEATSCWPNILPDANFVQDHLGITGINKLHYKRTMSKLRVYYSHLTKTFFFFFLSFHKP